LSKGRRRFSSAATKEIILESAKKRPLVCATILAKNKRAFLRTAMNAARLCDIAELRIDYLKEPTASLIKKIIAESPLPLIVTNRSLRDGGLFPKSKESLRISLIKSSLEFSPAMVDIELELPGDVRSELIQLAKKNNVGVICSHHDFASTPSIPRVLKLSKQISRTGADITKLVFMPSNHDDASRILKAANVMAKRRNLFTVFGMGDYGQITRLATLLFGSCLVYCTLGRADKKLGQIGVDNARKFINSLESYGHLEKREERARLLKVLGRELRNGEKSDDDFDPIAVLENYS
jgi:3-dehydroquinate dehydratase I